jgi:hypothetical protein
LSWTIEKYPAKTVVTFKAKTYVHAVQISFPLDTTPSDNFFDLLPGETRSIFIHHPHREFLENEIRISWVP